MGDSDNWRTEVDAGDFFGAQKKRQSIERRRPGIRRASDLVGPGIAKNAIRITDFSDILATFNGYFSAYGDEALDAPVGTHTALVGYVISDAEMGGVQVFTALDTGVTYRRTFERALLDPETIVWNAWV